MCINNVNDYKLLYASVYGLKDRVQAEVCLRNPKTLDKATMVALDFDKLLRP